MGKTAINLSFKAIEVEGYERVVEIKDEGLHALIAIHDTRLGSALGGIRAYPYKSFDQGLNDVLRLAKGMTYKAAIAGSGTGGGKSIIFTDPTVEKSTEMLRKFAEAVNFFEGNYICAEDVGIYPTDLEIICRGTPYVVGLPSPKSSGDPSRYTAFGGFRGIQAVCKKMWGSDSVDGRTFAIQGLGAVGMKVAQHLFWHGARLIVTDVNKEHAFTAKQDFGAKVVSPEEILSVQCDVLVPCALGAILNPNTIPHLRCQAIAGLANNQLLSDKDGEDLFKKGILYAPDYVINGGGLIAVCLEIEPEGFDAKTARLYIDRIYDRLLTIFKLSEEKKKPTHVIANEMAEYNLEQGIGRRNHSPVFHTAMESIAAIT